MKLKSIPRRLGYILGAQWTRDLAWTAFTILLARRSPDIMGQVVLALTFGYLVKTIADVGLNDFLLSTFARREGRPRALLGEVTWLKLTVLVLALAVTWLVTGWQNYSPELRLIVLCIAAGLGLDGVSDSFFALCQARGRQDVEMRIRVPSALIGIGFGIACVVMGAPPIIIALYKPIESILCIIFALTALGRNPLAGVGRSGMLDLARQMKHGLIFTCMAACAMFYNKINVIFLKQYGGNADVGGYGVAWETVEGLSVLVSSALLGKVIFPLLAKFWQQDKNAFRQLAGQTARSLWAASLPIIFLICVESDRFLPFILNIICCLTLIPAMPLEGAALSLTITKVWVAILTVGFFQWTTRPMSAAQWLLMLTTAGVSIALWWGTGKVAPREVAEGVGLLPLLALFWWWRPPPPFEKKSSQAE